MRNKTLPVSLEFMEYYDKLSEDEKKYIRQFYEEYHQAKFYTSRENIILDEDMKKEAIRNSNQAYRDDAFSVAQKNGDLCEFTEDQSQFMEEASDHWAWNNVFKQFGFEEAARCIMDQAVDSLKNTVVDESVILMRFYSKMNELSRLNRREKQRKKK